jgi:AcrR family transcriptional regulator
VLKADGYAGLTTAKVAARSGENKALISYHFGSKQGLVAAVGREVASSITAEVLEQLSGDESVRHLAHNVLAGLWRVMDRDQRLARLYFDLAAVSVVEPDVREVMREMKDLWRDVLSQRLVAAPDGPPPRKAEAGAVFMIAGLEGLMLERLDRGETPALDGARNLFVDSVNGALAR